MTRVAFSQIDFCVVTIIILEREGHLLVIWKCDEELTRRAARLALRIGSPGVRVARRNHPASASDLGIVLGLSWHEYVTSGIRLQYIL
jgi:hypothetical protein